MKFTTEEWGNALAVLSAERNNSDDEPQLLGLASVDKVKLSDGRFSIRVNLEIRPYCELEEIKEVTKILMAHINQNMEVS